MVVGRRDQRGFAFIEVVIAFAVVSVLVVGLSGGGLGHGRSVTRSFQESQALAIAQSHLEELRAGEQRVQIGRAVLALDAETRDQLPAVTAHRAARVQRPGLLEVEVVVGWTPSGAERPVAVALTTLLIDRGPR